MNNMKAMSPGIFVTGFLSVMSLFAASQKTTHYDLPQMLKEQELITTSYSQTSVLAGDRKEGIRSVNSVWFKNISFSEGVIDVDMRGKDAFLKSFLGIIFHGVDTVTYDVLYFRPFNFRHTDTARRHWSVQYMSLPDNDFMKLRKDHPLVYESTVDPVPDPDGWFHVTLVIRDSILMTYINHSSRPSLEVRLLNSRRNGALGLFSDGYPSDFANLTIGPIH
jgi:hypothetical protein